MLIVATAEVDNDDDDSDDSDDNDDELFIFDADIAADDKIDDSRAF